MASEPRPKWHLKLRGGHVRVYWPVHKVCMVSLHGELMLVAGVPVRARARGQSVETALGRLWQMVQHVPLVPEPVGSDAQLEKP